MQNGPFLDHIHNVTKLELLTDLYVHHSNFTSGKCGANFNHFIYFWVA